MRTYQSLSTRWRLAALAAAVCASAIVTLAALLPFGLDGPERGDAIVAREAALQAVRNGTAGAAAADGAATARIVSVPVEDAFR